MTGNDPSPTDDASTELVSVIMSNYRGAPYLATAVHSVLAQSHRNLELLVVDDASDDDSVGILREIAASDPRLRPIALTENVGPAVARNVGLDAAQGRWVAIVDSDDIVHPERIGRLLSAAARLDLDMVADDMVQFGTPSVAGSTVLGARVVGAALRITPAGFVESDGVSAGLASLGYLKPMIRRDLLGPIRYDEGLRIGEDFDLCLRLLIAGGRYAAVPDPTYLYRRHAGSISHRLTEAAMESLIAAHRGSTRAAMTQRPDDAALHASLERRAERLSQGLRYERLVRAIKSRAVLSAAALIARHPRLLRDLAASLADRRARGVTAEDANADAAGTLVLASPQNIDDVPAPSGALRIPVPPMRAPGAETGDTHVALAGRLATLAERGGLDVLAFGPAGLHALGYLPGWRSARITLSPEEARTVILPRNATLELAPVA